MGPPAPPSSPLGSPSLCPAGPASWEGAKLPGSSFQPEWGRTAGGLCRSWRWGAGPQLPGKITPAREGAGHHAGGQAPDLSLDWELWRRPFCLAGVGLDLVPGQEPDSMARRDTRNSHCLSTAASPWGCICCSGNLVWGWSTGEGRAVVMRIPAQPRAPAELLSHDSQSRRKPCHRAGF